ncbi:ABC transporter ATP-binding protein [Arcanobacterium haemolyticum]|nr:ABC transporter ATP-binding protein [Arcanobacterium haemolyticum]QCX46410.1 ABC transporter ATP-binding protein [Arcanobacterium haemolyticum]
MNEMNLRGRGLHKTYGDVNALAGVDIDIAHGEHVAIMGPSGSGKSTLLHVLSGILTPDEGQVTIGSIAVSGLNDAKRSELRRRVLGFVFQDGQLVPELTARENVAFPLLLTGISRRKAMKTADSWLERLGVRSQANKRPGEMSGGQAQRVAIARALVHDPAVLFADEPTGALDQATGHEVMQLLTATAKMNGTTLVVITHDTKVASWCERLIEIRDGLIHYDGAVTR